MDQIIKAMEDEFVLLSPDKPMDYVYGFMDALAVIREMRDGIRHAKPDVCDTIQAKE